MANILVVDDSVDAARVLARLLRHFGHHVDVVHSGEDALAAVAQTVPDLMILDLMMPGVDGAEVLRRVREVPQMHAMRVAMFSAVTDPAVRDHCLRRGAQDFWTKASFDFGELAERVRRLLADDAAAAAAN